jgi:hypothetical protein
MEDLSVKKDKKSTKKHKESDRSCDKIKIEVLVNEYVGFKDGQNPVPATLECLSSQAIPGSTTTVNRNSVVEPFITVNPVCPQQIVVAFQEGRISNTGALEIGITYSKDGGKSLKHTIIPLQRCLGGPNQRSSDIWLSWSADGKRVYLVILHVNATLDPTIPVDQQSSIQVSYSDDGGRTWSTPATLIASDFLLSTFTGPDLDKTSITADPNKSCYVYVTFEIIPQFTISFSADTWFVRSNDYGTTWFPPQLVYRPAPDLLRQGLSSGNPNTAYVVDNKVVVLPEKCFHGELLIFMTRQYAPLGATEEEYFNDVFPYQFTQQDFVVIRSKNHGISWSTDSTIVYPVGVNNFSIFTGGYTYDVNRNITGGIGTLIRDSNQVSSVAVNRKTGDLYFAFICSDFRSDLLPQIGLVISRDGGHTWSDPYRVNRTPQKSPNSQAFTPSVTVTEDGYVGIMYVDFRNDDRSDVNNTLTDIWLSVYKDEDELICKTKCRDIASKSPLCFIEEIRLTKKSFVFQFGPRTGGGTMVTGDYMSLVSNDHKLYAAYIVANQIPPNIPQQTLINQPDGTKLILDENVRTLPYVAVVKIDDN